MLFTLLGGGDVLALHSCTLENREGTSKQVEDLQKLYEGYMKDKEAAEAALKGQGLGLAKAVRKSLEAKTDEL